MLFRSGLVDRVVAFVAPMLLGGRTAPGPTAGTGLALPAALRLEGLTVSPVGEDLVIEGDVMDAAEAEGR